MGYRIKIGVGGRFHADRLVRALNEKGWDVSLVTSLPRNRFKGINPEIIESHILPEIIYRLGMKIAPAWASDHKMKKTGEAFCRSCKKGTAADVVLAWSGFAVEAFKASPRSFKVLVRDSTHILEQVEVLESEYHALGILFPDHENTIERELEEYRLADKIVVLSQLAKESFLKRGVPESKLAIVRLGADLEVFSSREIKKGPKGPLQVVYFGTLSIRKGVIYLLAAMETFSPNEAQLTCIGAVEPGMQKILNRFKKVTFLPPLPHRELGKALTEYDIFVMPTLEDGFGLVIPQAMAAGLVPIVSIAAGASELITHGKNGYLVPPKNAEAIREAIKSLLKNPRCMEDIRANVQREKSSLSWDNYGNDFDAVLRAGVN